MEGRQAVSELGYEVFCHICGKPYLEQDPEVRFIYTDHVWECFDEPACLERAALERML
jgi:hypothetical protein